MGKNEVTIEDVIKDVRHQLSDNGVRITEIPISFNYAWWAYRGSEIEQFTEQLKSDYGVSSGPKEITEEFNAEVKAIHECLDRLGHTPSFAKWQIKNDPLYASMNQRATALSIWEQIAFPLRRRGDVIFRIFAPRGILGGTPMVEAMFVDEFIRGVSAQTARDKIELAQLRKQIRNWRNAIIILGIILVMVALTLFR